MTAPDPSDVSGRRFLVTGASGFIGSRLTGSLADRGAEVHGVSRRSPEASDGRVEGWQGDLRDLAFVRETLATVEPEIVIHLAAMVTGSRDVDVVLPVLEHTLLPTVNVLVAAAERGRARIVLVGSVEEAGPSADEPFPRSPYAAAKGAASSYGRMFHELYGLPVVHVRPAMVYGPGQRDLSKLVPYTIVSLLRGRGPRIRSGERQADWVYVDDVVAGLLAASITPGTEGRSFELGTGELTPVRAVVSEIDRLVGAECSPEASGEGGRAHECERPADVGTAEQHLGWRPTVTLSEGLARTVAWYREHL